MKILFVLSCFLALKGTVFSQNAQFDWAQKSENSVVLSITTDALGNVYCVGYFKNTVDLDPGAGTFNLTSAGDHDIFVTKKDSLGNLIWAKKMGGSLEDVAYSVKLDNIGNILITGTFKGTCDFDPGSNSFNLSSAGDSDMFICKLNPSGDFLWSKQIGGIGADYGLSLAIDQTGNVYTSVAFRYTVDADPSPGVTNFVAGLVVNSLILKLDESGDFIWAKQFYGANSIYAPSLTLDQFGNLYTTGHFSDTVDFDPSTGVFELTSSGNSDVFVSKIDTLGNFIWAKSIGQASGGDDGYSVVTDGSGNVYVSGFFQNTVDFDPNAGVFNLSVSGGTNDVDGFILKLSGTGNFVWAKQISGTFESIAENLKTDNSGNLYVTGYFFGVTDFDPGIGVYNLPNIGNRDIFVEKFDPTGNFVWAKQIGGSGYDQSFAIEVDINRNIYTAGNFEGTVDFNTEAGVYNLSESLVSGSFTGFTHKLKKECTAPISSSINSQSSVSCNGGSNGSASVSASGGTGTLSYSWSPNGGNSATATGLVAGNYTCTIADVNLCSTTQTIVITQPTALSATALSQTHVSCFGGSNGTAAINTPIGGAGTFTYNWTPGNPTGDGTTSVTGLTAGTWTCTVTDENGCNATQNFSITQALEITSSISSQNNVSCNGLNDGSVTIMASGGTGTLNYSWSPIGGNSFTAIALTAGTYICAISDLNGCTGSQLVTITEPLPIDITTSVQGGTITSNQIGENYQWIDCDSINQVIPGATAQSYTPTANGSYAVVVSFSNSCLDTSDCVVITTLDLKEQDLESEIQIYPNPSQGVFFIESRRAINATIIDGLGKAITNIDLKEGINQIDLSTKARGVYYIHLDGSSQHQKVQLIINN